MKRTRSRWISVRPLLLLRFVPTIFRTVENWPSYLLDYAGLVTRGNTYHLRNGLVIEDREGTLTGTIAVVFIRREYGDVSGRSTIVDIGANLGVFTLCAASESRNATVYAYEPSRTNFEMLVRNVEANQLSDRVKTFEQGVAAVAGDRVLHTSQSNLHTLFDGDQPAETATIACTSLEGIFEDNGLERIDLLKVNCEGAEYEIFYSAEASLLRRIDDIRLEYHELDSDQCNGAALRRFLEASGYSITRFTVDARKAGFIWAQRS